MATKPPQRTPYLPNEPAQAPLRLLCFHHAGGSASVFTHWQRALGPEVAVLPVQLPGRERRYDEPRPRHLPTLIAELDAELDPWLQEPWTCYGHSLGALLAYSLVARRAAAGRTLPERLMVGALPAPHRPRVRLDHEGMSEEEFARRLVDLGGISPTVQAYPKWLRAAAALARDDLALCSGPPLRSWTPLPCPVDVFTGQEDPLMREGDADEWAEHTRATFTIQRIPGGHFFPWESPEIFLGRLAHCLRLAAGGVRRGQPA